MSGSLLCTFRIHFNVCFPTVNEIRFWMLDTYSTLGWHIRENTVPGQCCFSKPFVCFLGSLAVKTHEINHEGNHHLPPACASFLGWAVPTERLIWLYARRWGFWDRPRRSCSYHVWTRASGTSVSLPLSMPPPRCAVFWFGWVGAGGSLSLPCFMLYFWKFQIVS